MYMNTINDVPIFFTHKYIQENMFPCDPKNILIFRRINFFFFARYPLYIGRLHQYHSSKAINPLIIPHIDLNVYFYIKSENYVKRPFIFIPLPRG